jgi:hypothetical protein
LPTFGLPTMARIFPIQFQNFAAKVTVSCIGTCKMVSFR